MRRALTALAVLALGAGIARAQPSDLSNGVFITHHPPGIVYSAGWGSWCPNYSEFAIATCEEQNPTIPLGEEEKGVWFVLGAFDGDKAWCGVEFGLGNYDSGLMSITENGQCPTDALIIPSGNWPGPNTGVSLAATATSWSGNFLPVYWFVSYSYYGDPMLVHLTANPETGFGGFANCLTPPTGYPAQCFGAMGINMPGIACCPALPTQRACCICEECVLVSSAEECMGMGGVYHPEWDTCAGVPCSTNPEPHVCCVGNECFLIDGCDCGLMGGEWFPELDSCGPPNPCETGTLVEPSTWGSIKAMFR
jgi:hypothetical protein